LFVCSFFCLEHGLIPRTDRDGVGASRLIIGDRRRGRRRRIFGGGVAPIIAGGVWIAGARALNVALAGVARYRRVLLPARDAPSKTSARGEAARATNQRRIRRDDRARRPRLCAARARTAP
jgi:hypothetical protein